MIKTIGLILDLLAKLNIIKLIIAFVITVVLFLFKFVPLYDDLPFKEFNVYVMFLMLFFLIFLMLILIEKTIKMYIKNSSDAIQREILENEIIERTYVRIDKLDRDGINFVIQQLNNGNTPFYYYKITTYNHIFSSDLVSAFDCIDETIRKKMISQSNVYSPNFDYNTIFGYQLDKDLYKNLCIIYKKTGRISNSNREKGLIEIK